MIFSLEELYQKNKVLSNLLAFAPEILLFLALIVVLISVAFQGDKQLLKRLSFSSIFLIFSAFLSSFFLFFSIKEQSSLFFFQNNFLIDAFALVLKSLVIFILFYLTVVSKNYFKQTNQEQKIDSQIFLISGTIGACLIFSCYDLIGLFVALELLSISNIGLISLFDSKSFSLVNTEKDPGYPEKKFGKLSKLFSREASLKYLLNSAVASAFLLFGFSILFLLSQGETNLAQLKLLAKLSTQDQTIQQILVFFLPMLFVALVFILGALSFKLSLVPFHLWTPDVYQGACLPATAFLSTIAKIAGFVAFIRIFWNLFEFQIYGLAIFELWRYLAFIIVCLSIIVASLVGLKQTFTHKVSLKKILAYSSISQIAYLVGALITEKAFTGMLTVSGLESGSISGLRQSIFYLIFYSLVNLGIFVAAIIWETEVRQYFSEKKYSDSEIKPEYFEPQKTPEVHLDYYQGLFYLKPKLSVFMAFCFASLAGVLPVILIPKFLLITSIFKTASFSLLNLQATAGLLMGLFILLGSVISIYFYFLPIKKIFLEKPLLVFESLNQNQALSQTSFQNKFVLYSLGFIFILISFFPGFLLDKISQRSALSALISSETISSEIFKQNFIENVLKNKDYS